jgi:predicted chitinase
MDKEEASVFDAALLKLLYTNPAIEKVPDIPAGRAEKFAAPLGTAMRKHGINTRNRAAHFLAQVGYESGCLSYFEEFGGPNASYAPYYGRGPIMLTHREPNYRVIGEMIGVDLVNSPGIIGSGGDPRALPRNPAKSLESAAASWAWRGLSEFADKGDAGFDDVMLRVLGAAQGHPSYGTRLALYRAIKGKLKNSVVLGDEMAWERVILAHAGFEDGQLCADAYKVLMGAQIQASIANTDNIKGAIDFFQSFDVTNGEAHFVVVGQGAQQKFPANLRPFIGAPEDESDYRDAVGIDREETRQKLAGVLDGIEEGLGQRFLES